MRFDISIFYATATPQFTLLNFPVFPSLAERYFLFVFRIFQNKFFVFIIPNNWEFILNTKNVYSDESYAIFILIMKTNFDRWIMNMTFILYIMLLFHPHTPTLPHTYFSHTLIFIFVVNWCGILELHFGFC